MTPFLRSISAAGAIALGALIAAGPANALTIKGDEITLRMGSGHQPFITYVDYMTNFFAKKVSERVAKETKYTVKWQEHYSGTLVKVTDTLEGVQDGRLDIGGWCVCFDDDKAMAMNVTYFVPFGMPDSVKAQGVIAQLLSEFPELYQDYEKRYNQKLLAQGGFGNYGMLTRFDWSKFEDLKGRKILAAGPNLPWVSDAAIPVETTIPTAAQQLQTGVGEGIILFPDSVFKLKLHEATGGGTWTNTNFGTVIQNSLTMNLDTRKKLPAEVVKIIDEVANEWAVESTRKSQQDYEWGVEQLKKAGVKVSTLSDEEKQTWAERLKAWPNQRAQEVKTRKGVDMPKIMKRYIQLMAEAGHKTPIDYPIE